MERIEINIQEKLCTSLVLFTRLQDKAILKLVLYFMAAASRNISGLL